MLQGKKILLGISGGIAAYKAPEIIRLFSKKGASVRVVATRNALQFTTRVTLESLSRWTVYSDMFAPVATFSTEHIDLTDWADVFVVAPATANIIGKYANGIADDALSTSLIAFNKPVFIAPAMNCKMYEHASFVRNLDFLKEQGVRFIEPVYGQLACGYEGKGRMEEPEAIVEAVEKFLQQQTRFAGKKVLITAGSTHEAIDPVRFIGNHSSGKMGFALAQTFAENGAEVTLVSGPTSLQIVHPNIKRIDVVSAQQMYEACIRIFPETEIAILAAAVADFTPEVVADSKIKKQDKVLEIKLKPTIDILAELGKQKKNQKLIGFALETDNELENAKKKLVSKNLDMIVLNSLKDEGAGFGTPTNKITIINKNGEVKPFEIKSKKEVAQDILAAIFAN